MKTIKFLALTALLLFNSGCVLFTPMLWKEKIQYKETIQGYLISNDGKKVVFLGEKYHYIFDDESGEIKQLLQWKQKLSMSIYNFKAVSKNNVELGIALHSHNNPSSEEIDSLKKLGFTEGKLVGISKDIFFYKKYLHLSGTRYLPKEGVNYTINSTMKYNVTVEEGYYGKIKDASKKIALTPIAVAADTILIAGITLAFIQFHFEENLLGKHQSSSFKK